MKRRISWALFLTLLLSAFSAWSRAGGAGGGGGFGGGHSYGGGYGSYSHGGDSGDIIFLIIYLLQRPVGWVLLVVLGLVAWFYLRNAQEGVGEPTMFNSSLPAVKREPIPLSAEQLTDITRKVQVAFLTIQRAWSQKNVALMRRFITDGVYQRFHAQFTMMNLLDQTNVISDVNIMRIDAVKYRIEGDYECIDLQIRAEATDQFVSVKYPQFNSPGGREGFTEVWSFLRRKDSSHRADIFHQNQCPQCSGPLGEQLMETARCPYCGVYINSGEFDWVLSEITQAENYGQSKFGSSVSSQLAEQILQVQTQDGHFSRQVLEDRASNAFLQVLIGLAQKNIQGVQRFATIDCVRKLEQIQSLHDYVFDRLYLKSVDLLSLAQLENHFVQATVAIEYVFERVQLQDGRAVALDGEMISRSCIISLIHQITSQATKGSIYANSCPQCGGTQKDSLNAVCEYCGSVLNDPRGDWIVADIDFR